MAGGFARESNCPSFFFFSDKKNKNVGFFTPRGTDVKVTIDTAENATVREHFIGTVAGTATDCGRAVSRLFLNLDLALSLSLSLSRLYALAPGIPIERY